MKPRPPRDEGVALLMVLAFVLVMSVIVGALLEQSFTTLRAARVSADIERRVYAANAGVDWAIQQLRLGALASDGRTSCPDTGANGQVLKSDLSINGRVVTVTCTVTAGASAGAGGWAVFITDPNGGIVTQPSSQAEKLIYGPVYDRGTFVFNGGTSLKVENGDLRTAGSCPGGGLTLDPARACAIKTLTDLPRAPVDIGELPNIWNDAIGANYLGTTSGRCHTLHPGRYDAGHRPDLLARANGTNYLESGVYYFDDAGPLVLSDVRIVGGTPAPDEQAVTSAPASAATDCAGQMTPVAGQYGVVIVLGGSSSIELRGDADVELFGYHAGLNGGALSVYQLDTEWDVGPPANERSTVRGAGTPIVSTTAAVRSALALHGTVYTPYARVALLGTNQSVASLAGGVVAAALELQTNPAADHLLVAARSAPGVRTIRIEATTNRVGSEKDLPAIADVSVTNDASRAVSITSWIVNQ